MHPVAAFIRNPIKVSVAVLMVAMFGIIALFRMPMQLTPEVETPTITIETGWSGATPHEVEREIIQEQEEFLKSVEGVTKMTSECRASLGTITMEFLVGTDMQEAVLKVNSQLQQVKEYPENVDKPVIRTASSEDQAIAWFILSARPVSRETIEQFQAEHPKLRDHIQPALDTKNVGLSVLRLRRLAEEYPEVEALLPPDIVVPHYRRFAEDFIEAEFERVPGVANSNVLGGQEDEAQVIVDPYKLAARNLTISDVRSKLREYDADISGGDFWEGKRRYNVRTLGQFRNLQQVEDVILAEHDGQYVYLRDVVVPNGVRMGYKKPDGFVRRFGTANIAINATRETGANVIDVMEALRKRTQQLNDGILKEEGLVLTQVYDETEYVNSAVGLVQQNIILGGTLTVIVLMMFLHLDLRTLLFVPLLVGTALAAVKFSPWIFLLTLLLICVAGIWFARGALIVALAIPISIVGTFLMLNLLGRSLNVISLAGLAFAVGMLVDNAVVVLENVYRHWQSGMSPFAAAERATKEVWGAVVASTLTTLAVFLPVIFMQGEAGQLFRDIALAISSAVGLSLFVSVTVIPTASARILGKRTRRFAARDEAACNDPDFEGESPLEIEGRGPQSVGGLALLARFFVEGVVAINRFIQSSMLLRLVVAGGLVVGAVGLSILLWPKAEYLPTGNRNLVICLIMPPPGYNLAEMMAVGQAAEDVTKPYWDVAPGTELVDGLPAIGDFFFVVRNGQVFFGLRAANELDAHKLINLVRNKLQGAFPGTIVIAFQSSLFSRGLQGGRTIDVEITGTNLEELVAIGGQMMGRVKEQFPSDTQMRPIPSLDLSNPELHVVLKPQQAEELGVTTPDLGYTVDALVDGAYAADYFRGSDKIDLVIMSSIVAAGQTADYTGQTQDLEQQYVATPNHANPVRLGTLAHVEIGSGPEQINHRERNRAITIEVTPPRDRKSSIVDGNRVIEKAMSVTEGIDIIQNQIIPTLRERGAIGEGVRINLSGTADKLEKTWDELFWNFIVALIITYLLMAALFESWLYPFVIIVSVPLGAVGGVLGLYLLNGYLYLIDKPVQNLDVLTMLGFIILIGTVVNNAILIVHQALNLIREEGMNRDQAILESVRTRIRPIFMTTATTCLGLAPLVFFPGAGAELYRGLGSVVLGGLLVSTVFTLFLVPTLFSFMLEVVDILHNLIWPRPASETLVMPPETEPNVELEHSTEA